MARGGYREMWRIAAPLILSMSSYTIMQFTDRVFLARYSSVAIQAVLPAGLLAHTLVCFFQAVASYSGTFAAHYHGAGEPDACVRSTVQGFWLAILSFPLILLLLPVGSYLFPLIGHAPDVVVAEQTYFTILMLGGLIVPLNSAAGGYFMGIGETRANLFANSLGCLLNIVLNYGMIFGHFGFAEMGIRGAAYATVISGGFTFVLYLWLLSRDYRVRQYLRRSVGVVEKIRSWGCDLHLMLRILRFGTPHGLQLFMDIGAFSMFVMLTGRLGELELAASNIAFSINNLAFAPLLGFAMAASTVVGQHQGAQRPDAAARAGYTGLKLALLYMCLIGATFLLFPKQYFTLFNPVGAAYTGTELLSYGRKMLLLMTFWGLFDTVNIVISGALKGAGDTRFVMIYLIVGGWMLLVPGALVALYLGFGIIGLWSWLTFYVCIMAVGFGWRWHSGAWRTIDLIGIRKGADYMPMGTDDIY